MAEIPANSEKRILLQALFSADTATDLNSSESDNPIEVVSAHVDEEYSSTNSKNLYHDLVSILFYKKKYRNLAQVVLKLVTIAQPLINEAWMEEVFDETGMYDLFVFFIFS